jgi:hypothetical protein
MPRLVQGDVFREAVEWNADLAIVFGHFGFNQMGVRWLEFAKTLPPPLSDVKDPFVELGGRPHRATERLWLWFVGEGENHGLTDDQLVWALDDALAWATEQRMTRIITNGIANVNRLNDDRRAKFLAQYAADKEASTGLTLTLINLNDVFTRAQ